MPNKPTVSPARLAEPVTAITINGPIPYAPDGNPLVGPVPGLRNMWIAEGFSFGITAAGGTGYYLAQMMVNGEAEIDSLVASLRRILAFFRA